MLELAKQFQAWLGVVSVIINCWWFLFSEDWDVFTKLHGM